MGKSLSGYVAAVNPDTGMTEILDPTAPLPAWANSETIPNPAAWVDGVAREPESVTAGPAHPEGEPSEAWKLDELKAYAKAQGLAPELQDATRKAAILDALKSDDDEGKGSLTE